MSFRKFKEDIIQLVPIRRLRKFLSYNYGWFPKNRVAKDAIITSKKNLKLGGNVYIGNHGTQLHCAGGVSIGYGTYIAGGTIIMSTNHNYKSKTHLPFDGISIAQSVEIGEYCWIGAKSCICPGVKIEDGAVVAMGSVVTKSVPKGAVVGGNPARILKYRDLKVYEDIRNRKKPLPRPSGLIKIEGFKEYLN